jgi:FlaA1/EpsC-like NDP-sugar epimerase
MLLDASAIIIVVSLASNYLKVAALDLVFLYLIALAIIYFTGYYNYGLRSLNYSNIRKLLIAFAIPSLIIYYTNRDFGVAFTYYSCMFFGQMAGRLIAISASDFFYSNSSSLKKVYIFGLNNYSLVHYDLLIRSGIYWPKTFVDDSLNLSALQPPRTSERKFCAEITKLATSCEVHIAPGYWSAFNKLALKLPSSVKVVNISKVDEYITGLDIQKEATFDSLNINDLLMRREYIPAEYSLKTFFKDKTVLITGGGGSIGSELCRQLLNYNVKKMVLVDSAEYSLYTIQEELKDNVAVTCVLCNACDYEALEAVFAEHSIDTVFHAAAYKHVPLVEASKLSSLRNNVVATFNTCSLSHKYKVKNYCLISTDKAVRPTNVMGASKRLCEKVMLSFGADSITTYSSVRFGNVLGSSGSVVPLFLKQIYSGGPITLTDKKITRYFMSIPEAVSLVLMSCEFADGNDLFLLDMGEPVKIYDLACSLILATGKIVSEGPSMSRSEIQIIESGLRPGEKLYEELLIGDDISATKNDKIFRAYEGNFDCSYKDDLLKELIEISHADVYDFLMKHVEGYSSSGEAPNRTELQATK